MKKYTQIGTILIALFLPLLILSGIALFKMGLSFNLDSIALQAGFLLILICLLTFYKLTIFIDEAAISFKFGIGWFGKSYKFSEISSCEPVKNQLLHGIGIRFLGNGWLYNVSGLKAVELRFKNKKPIVRIGTDQPEEICEAIRRKIY